MLRVARARRGAGGRRLPLRCGGRPFGPTPLRCSPRGAAAMHSAPAPERGRPINASRRSGAARRTAPAALRCSAPQRRRTRRPPAPSREPAVQLATARRVASSALLALLVELLGAARKAVGGRAAERLCGAEERWGPGVAHRLKAMRRAQPVRAPSIGSSRSEMPAMRGRVLRSPPGTDALSPDERQSLRTVFRLAKAKALASALARRGVGAQRRPPQRSAAARPPTALLVRSSGTGRASTAAAKRTRSLANGLARLVVTMQPPPPARARDTPAARSARRSPLRARRRRRGGRCAAR